MTQDFRETEIEFYGRCAEILGVEHAFKERFGERTRWNNRMPGNGRFPGFGLVRMFAADRIQMIPSALDLDPCPGAGGDRGDPL